MEWTRLEKGPSEYLSWNALAVSPDGGILAAGAASSGKGRSVSDVMPILRTDPQGATLWSRTVDFEGRDESPSYAAFTSDGGAIVTGTLDKMPYVKAKRQQINSFTAFAIRLDAAGKTVWSRRYRKAGNSVVLAARETAEGGYLLIGKNHQYNKETPVCPGLWALRLDSSGSAGDVVCLDPGGGVSLGFAVPSGDGFMAVGDQGNSRIMATHIAPDLSFGTIWEYTFSTSGLLRKLGGISALADGSVAGFGVESEGDDKSLDWQWIFVIDSEFRLVFLSKERRMKYFVDAVAGTSERITVAVKKKSGPYAIRLADRHRHLSEHRPDHGLKRGR
ncbi:MAG: hypothetical protein LBT40_13340 [Deltaproteobacteria bacterium]|nr:hypothetical protein [Deltaproteobacteria bacterium]